MRQEDFTATFGPLADDIAKQTGLSPQAVLGIVAQETGWGDHFTGNNIFGISPGGQVARYPTIQAAGQAFVDLINSRYSDAKQGKTPEDQVRLIGMRGYNPSAAYPSLVTARMATMKGGQQGGAGPSDDDLLVRTRKVAPRPTETPAGAAPTDGGVTTTTQPDTLSDDDLLARTRQVAPPPKTEQKPPEPPPKIPDVDWTNVGPEGVVGSSTSQTPSSTNVTAPMTAAAAVPDMSPETTATLRHLGVYGPKEGEGTPIQRLNEQVASSFGGGIRLLGAGLGALQSGAVKGGEMLDRFGVPQPIPGTGTWSQFGRDVAALPEAFPFGHSTGIPEPRAPGVNRLLPQEARAATIAAENGSPLLLSQDFRAEPFRPFTENPLTSRAAGPFEPNPLVPKAETPIVAPPDRTVTATDLPPPGTEAGPRPGMGGPQSAGAAASREGTPPGQIDLTPEQAARARTVADKEWFNSTQQPGVKDERILIPGVVPTLVEQEQSVVRARELKTLRNQNPEVSQAERELLDHNNAKRKVFFDDTVGSDVTRASDLKAANEKIDADLARVWKDKGKADPSGVQAQIASELEGSAGHLPPLRSAMQQVSESLEKAGTDPEAMYRTRRLINYLQSREGKTANPGYGDGDVQAALTRAKAALDAAIEPAAPGFGQAMADYAAKRGPIDAAKELQARELSLYDNKGRMSFPAVHSLMRDIIKAQHWDAPDHALQFVSEQQMERLKALHDDLKRVASAHDLEMARGSDSAQNLWDIAKGVGKTAGVVGAHAVANKVAPVVGSLAVNAIGSVLRGSAAARAAREQARRGEQILRPPPPPLGPPPPGFNPMTGGPL